MAQVLIIKKGDKPYYVGLVSDIKVSEYQQLVKECEERHDQEEKEYLRIIAALQKELHELKGHVLFDEGKITLEEYENGNY